jgi:hypothetical protein
MNTAHVFLRRLARLRITVQNVLTFGERVLPDKRALHGEGGAHDGDCLDSQRHLIRTPTSSETRGYRLGSRPFPGNWLANSSHLPSCSLNCTLNANAFISPKWFHPGVLDGAGQNRLVRPARALVMTCSYVVPVWRWHSTTHRHSFTRQD